MLCSMDKYLVETHARFQGSGAPGLDEALGRLRAHKDVLADPPPLVQPPDAEPFALIQFTIEAANEVKAQSTALDVANEVLGAQDESDRLAEVSVSARRLEPEIE